MWYNMKKIAFISLFTLICVSFISAEDITITTYYPSPYGSYNEMRVNMLAVGASYQDAVTNPLTDGRLIVSNNVSINRNTAGNYGSENVRLDTNGYGAVNDLWLKSPKSGAAAGWVSNVAGGGKIKSGYYGGNGSAHRLINVGFRPKVVFIQREGGNRHWKVDGMLTMTLGDDGGSSINCVTSFYDQGFVLGSDNDCNSSSGKTHYYCAFGE